jgi:hypothetical protein
VIHSNLGQRGWEILMPLVPSANDPTFAPDWLRELDDVVNRFELAWQAGTRPDIAEFVTVDTAHRRQLLTELIQIEWEWRLKAGEDVTEETYRSRF